MTKILKPPLLLRRLLSDSLLPLQPLTPEPLDTLTLNLPSHWNDTLLIFHFRWSKCLSLMVRCFIMGNQSGSSCSIYMERRILAIYSTKNFNPISDQTVTPLAPLTHVSSFNIQNLVLYLLQWWLTISLYMPPLNRTFIRLDLYSARNTECNILGFRIYIYWMVDSTPTTIDNSCLATKFYWKGYISGQSNNRKRSYDYNPSNTGLRWWI